MLQIGTEVVYEPGEMVTWHGWDAIVVDVDFERRHPYRLQIQEATGRHFNVLAIATEVKCWSVASKRYTSTLAIALQEVEEEDQALRDSDSRQAESDYAVDHLRAALVQAEQELQWMNAWFWWVMAIVGLIGFVCGHFTRR